MLRKFIAIIAAVLIATGAVEGRELKKFIARGYITIADTTSNWVQLDSVHVSLSAANDTASVPFKLLSGNDATKTTGKDEGVRIMVYSGRGEYVLTLDREGYEPLMKEFKVSSLSQDVVWLGNMQMRKERINRLKEVEVVATAIKMVMNGDTIVYNADAFNLAEGSMLDALVKQLPGAELDAHGQIKVNGRFVSSLLVNGQDFFKGDPQVALQNLPAYTVKNIKVYDKAAEDDYLTHASAKLSRREEEENIVMDIVLKKEFSLGLLGSIEGGCGLQNRYVGKAFAMFFSDKFKIAAFGNANNVNNSDEFSFWNEGWDDWNRSGGGRSNMQKAGVNYNYDDSKRWKAEGNVMFTHNTNNTETQKASEQFFPGSNNLYGREHGLQKSSYMLLNSSHYAHYKGDIVFVNVQPGVRYRRSEQGILQRSAMFNAEPIEAYRTESLDSVSALTFSERSRYWSNLIRRTWHRDSTFTENIVGELRLSSKIAPANMRGIFNIVLYGMIDRTNSDSHTLMLQHFGGANQSTEPPINSDRYGRTRSHQDQFNARANYDHKWANIGEEWSRAFTLTSYLDYNYNNSGNTPDQFDAPADYEYSQTFLPSLIAPDYFVRNEMNSYNSTTTSNKAGANVGVSFKIERVAPVDTGFNPTFEIGFDVTDTYNKRRLDYRGHVDDIVNRNENTLKPKASLYLSSGDKRRYTYFWGNYSYEANELPLNIFLSTVNNSNPLAVYLNNAHNLQTPYRHHFWCYIGTYDRTKRQLNGSITFNYNKTENSLGQKRRFDPQTGVSTYTPCNIQGNWSTSASTTVSVAFGPEEAFNLGNRFGISYYCCPIKLR